MATHHQRDPLEDLIEDGRVRTRPTSHYGFPEILPIDLDRLAATLSSRVLNAYLYNLELGNYYGGTTDEVVAADVTAMVDFAVGQVYNRLRSILKRYHPMMLVSRMRLRCPIPNNQEFPAWLVSTLTRIGPCRITDGPRDQLLLYASSAATMQHYGRAAQIAYSEGKYSRLLNALKSRNVAMAAFDSKNLLEYCSYFPTLVPEISSDGVWTLYGTIHHSHYENEDVARTALCTNNEGLTPFESIGIMSIGYVSDAATVSALAAASEPEGIPEGQDAESAGRPVGGLFRVNYFGIQSAVSVQEPDPVKAPGIYVIGRGVEPYYCSVLAQRIYDHEVAELLRHRLLLV